MRNDFETADKGARLGNFVIDTIVFVIVFFIMFVLLSFIFPVVLEEEALVSKLLPFFIYFLYYFLFEYLLGKTPGKYLTKTLVIDRKGKRPGLGKAFIRSISRLIPFDIITYIFGLIGLHDLVSKTLVVRRKK